jgi:hypothetical protein
MASATHQAASLAKPTVIRFDLSATTTGVTVDLSNANAETVRLQMAQMLALIEVEKHHSGARDTVVLADGSRGCGSSL